MHSPDGSIFWGGDDIKAAILKVWRQIETPSIDPYLFKNIPAKFEPDQIWNNGALCFSEDSCPIVKTRATTRWWVTIWDQLLDPESNKKAVLLQRLPRNVHYIWMPGYAHTPFSPKCLMGFCSDGPCECSNVPAKFEVCSLSNIIWWYTAPCRPRPVTDCKMNDLEWLFHVKICK